MESEAPREANPVLKEMSSNLARDIVDSTWTFDRTIEGYDAVISVVKGALIEKRRENQELERELQEVVDVLGDADETVASYESLFKENKTLRRDLNKAN